LLLTVDAGELAEWEVLYGIEPWGEKRGDLQTALMCSVQASAWGGKVEPKKFVPNFWEQRRQTPQEMMLVAQAFAART
jgi:hypothetical protein